MNTPDQRLRRGLETMPQVPPPPSLWPRLEHARQRHVRRWKAGMASCAALLLCVALVPLLRDADRTDAALAVTPVQVLPAPVIDPETLARVRVLDRALQAAYDQGASDDEVAPLWVARRTLLSDPTRSRAPGAPDRT